LKRTSPLHSPDSLNEKIPSLDKELSSVLFTAPTDHEQKHNSNMGIKKRSSPPASDNNLNHNRSSSKRTSPRESVEKTSKTPTIAVQNLI